MAAVDTSTVIAYLQGSSGPDVEAFDHQLAAGQVVLPPAVLLEILSDPKLPAKHRAMILEWPSTSCRTTGFAQPQSVPS